MQEPLVFTVRGTSHRHPTATDSHISNLSASSLRLRVAIFSIPIFQTLLLYTTVFNHFVNPVTTDQLATPIIYNDFDRNN